MDIFKSSTHLLYLLLLSSFFPIKNRQIPKWTKYFNFSMKVVGPRAAASGQHAPRVGDREPRATCCCRWPACPRVGDRAAPLVMALTPQPPPAAAFESCPLHFLRPVTVCGMHGLKPPNCHSLRDRRSHSGGGGRSALTPELPPVAGPAGFSAVAWGTGG